MTSLIKNVELDTPAIRLIADALSEKALKYEDAAEALKAGFGTLAKETRMLSELFLSAFRSIDDNDVKLTISITPKKEQD